MEGMERLIEVELNDEERAMLARSVESVRRSAEETRLSGP
jgi:malate dehydrogenase